MHAKFFAPSTFFVPVPQTSAIKTPRAAKHLKERRTIPDLFSKTSHIRSCRQTSAGWPASQREPQMRRGPFVALGQWESRKVLLAFSPSNHIAHQRRKTDFETQVQCFWIRKFSVDKKWGDKTATRAIDQKTWMQDNKHNQSLFGLCQPNIKIYLATWLLVFKWCKIRQNSDISCRNRGRGREFI